MNKIIISGVVYNIVKDGNDDCPAICALRDICNTSGSSPCLLYGNVHFEVEQESVINWEQRRFELAKAALCGIIAGRVYPTNTIIKRDCQMAILYADEMNKQLKNKGYEQTEEENSKTEE